MRPSQKAAAAQKKHEAQQDRVLRAQHGAEMLAEGKVKNAKEAAALVDFKESTFRHYLKGRSLKEERNEKMMKLTVEEEKAVLKRCEDLGKWGFPPEIWDVRGIAETIAKERDPKIKLGARWVEKFRERHAEARAMYLDQLDYIRAARGDNVKIINNFFDMLERVVVQYEIKPGNTYNIDEIGFLMGYAKNAKVLSVIRDPHENGKLFRNQDGSREMATVVETMCGDGSADIDPMIIYKAEKLIQEWFKDLPKVPENFLFGRSPNGWTDQKMAMRYLERNFGPGSPTSIKAGNEYRLLIFDGHNSHVNPQFLHYRVKHKIIPLCLPPHTTHRLQPLDVSIFSAYKTYYSEALSERWKERLRGVSKSNFYLLIHNSREKAFSEANVRSGFWHTGLIPVDRSIVLRKIISPKKTPPPQSPSPSLPVLPSTPRKIDFYKAEEIINFVTPKKRRQLYDLGQTLLNGLSDNDPPTWRRRNLLQKAIRAGEWAFIQMDLKNQKIAELIKENRQLKDKQPQQRTQIPVEGFAVASKEEIEEFYRVMIEQEEEKQRLKLERASKKAERLSKLLVDTEEKKRKAERMEEENRLPKRWKSSIEHGKMEDQIRGNLEDTERELAQLRAGVKLSPDPSDVEITPEPEFI